MQKPAQGAGAVRDPITAVAAAPHMLLVGRSSGLVHCYSLPDLNLAGEALTDCSICGQVTLTSKLDGANTCAFDWKPPRQKLGVTGVGFEPTPFRTSALSWRLRPLGQPILEYSCL